MNRILSHAKHRSPLRSPQKGSVMWVVILLAVVSSLLAMNMTSTLVSQFHGARNERDLTLARQAAEAALRDAEADMTCKRWNAATGQLEQAVSPAIQRAHCLSLAPVCAQLMPSIDEPGMRLLGRNPSTAPAAINWTAASCTDSSCAIELGSRTGMPEVVGVKFKPRYHVDVLDVAPTGDAQSLPLYRISVRGFGATQSAYVDLQEMFRPCR
jgi:type IV pilus assembly protein PilX